MIAEDKDRLECLKLAVGLVIPRHTVATDKMAAAVLDAAKQFYAFVRNEPEKAK